MIARDQVFNEKLNGIFQSYRQAFLNFVVRPFLKLTHDGMFLSPFDIMGLLLEKKCTFALPFREILHADVA